MKRTIFILATLLGMTGMSEAVAQTTMSIIPGVSVENFNMNRNGKYLTVTMDIDLSELDVNSNRAVLLTPRLVNGTDSIDLPSIGIYGHRRYYYYIRNGISTISGETEKSFKASNKPEQLEYDNHIPYENWMDGATLKFHRSDWGCCQEILAEYDGLLGRHREAFFPELVFVQPKAEVMKSRSLSGSAYIDFPVDQTVIYPDYRRNTVELGKIQATIDSVRNDKDITAERFCFARKPLQAQYRPCHRAYRRTQETHWATVPFCRQYHPDRLRAGRLGGSASFCGAV